MANIHRFIDDVETKKTLKENEGIGTEATRAGIIETLKQRGYIKADKKNLVSTELGQNAAKHLESFLPRKRKANSSRPALSTTSLCSCPT